MAAPALSMRQFDFVKLCIPGEVKALTALFRQIVQPDLGQELIKISYSSKVQKEFGSRVLLSISLAST